MEPTTLSDQSKPKSAAVSVTVGMLELLDENGQTAGTWRLTQPRCTIGSSNESLICVADSSMAAVHTLIVFGKNHTLIRAMGGQVRVSGRSVREWLIDEPTGIQCGASRFVVYPPGHQPNARVNSPRVSAGSVADQAARLRSVSSVQTTSLDGANLTNEDARRADEPTSQVFPTESPTNVEPPPGPPAFVVAKLDPDVVKTALEPLHLALQAANDGIIELTRRANESAAQIVDIPPINNNLNEMTHAIETLEDRVNSISNYCENLLSNVTESIEGRMSRFDELLLKLAERPDATITHDPHRQFLHADEGYDANALMAYQSPSGTFQQPPPEAFVKHNVADASTSYEEPIQQFGATPSPSYEETAYEETVYEQQNYRETGYEETASEDVTYENRSYEDASNESSTSELEGTLREEIAFNETIESFDDPAEPSYFSEMADLASSRFTEEQTIDESQSYSYEAQDFAPETPNSYSSEPTEVSYESEVTSEISNFDLNDYTSQVAEAIDSTERHKPELPSWFTETEPDAEPVSKTESSLPFVAPDSTWSTAQLNPIYAEDSNRWLEETEGEAISQEVELELAPSDLDSLSPMTAYEETTTSEEASTEANVYGSSFGRNYGDETATTEELESELEDVYEEVPVETIERGEESEDSEESIEAYMARLLQRVKGGPDAEEAPSKATSKAPQSREIVTPVSPVTESAMAYQAPVRSPGMDEIRSSPKSPAEFSPRQAAPEKSVDLAVLRNLANDTARQALHNSSRKRNELILLGKILISLLGLGGGILLLVLNGFRANVAMIGMIASFVVFLLWGYEAVVQFSVLQASKAKEASDNENSENR